MKKLILAGCFLSFFIASHAQLGGVINKAKQKAEQKANQKVDQEIDKQVDGEKQEPAPEQKTNEAKPADTAAARTAVNEGPATFQTYSKFDFVPGEKIVVFEDFSQDAIGDFPAKWNTNASAEVVTVEGKPGHWLMFTKPGFFRPEYIDSFPDNFTFEFDLLCTNPADPQGYEYFFYSIAKMNDVSQLATWWSSPSRIYVSSYPGRKGNPGNVGFDVRKKGVGEAGNSAETQQFTDRNNPVHISIWRQKERLRIYYNQEKICDLPKAMVTDEQYNSLIFRLDHVTAENPYCINNLRLAVGAPDTRSKFITEGKWVTHGILFDVNSANIKPESYGTIKQMADVLKENADVKVKIIGYTDSDGDEAKNLDLSKRRAASVKDVLANEFSIDASRMETDGKGEGSPIDTNNTPEGKANNRRVEFVKM